MIKEWKKENLKNMKKDIVRTMLCMEYFRFCKIQDKKIIFIYNNNQLTVKEAEKIFKAYAKSNNIKNWRNFTKQFAEFAITDKEFLDELEDQDGRCEKCGYKPTEKKKLSKYHKDYNKQKFPDGKVLYDDGTHPEIWIEYCPMCNNKELYITGVDKNPEEGLR